MEQVDIARRKGFKLYGCNLTFRDIPDLTVLHACNWQFWDHYADEVQHHAAAKWTTRPESAAKYSWLNYIKEVNKPGLSVDPSVIHHGHSSGFQLLGLARHHGATRIVLLGFDLRYPNGYDGGARISGGKRHYFGNGEYDAALQHWPQASTSVKDGVMIGLIPYYESVAEQGIIEILNATPDSALTCFPRVAIDAL